MVEKNFYLETYEKHYINEKENLSINKVKKILINFCHMQDLINTNINDLASCFGNVLKDLKNNKKEKKLETFNIEDNLEKNNLNLEVKNDLKKKNFNLEINSNFEKEKLNLESKNFAEKKFSLKKFAFKKKNFYLENFDEDEFRKDLAKSEILKNSNIDKNLNVKNYLEKRNIFFKGKNKDREEKEEIKKEDFDMEMEEIDEKFSSDKDDEFDNILNIKRELKFFKKKISKKRKNLI